MSAPAQSTNQPPTRLRGDIQGLRAVAVGLVVLNHAGVPGFGGGYVGVDVFFVISGYLITGILLRELDRTGRVSLLGFYARRARRILPAASVTLLVVTVAAALTLSSTRVQGVLGDVTWASLFGANVNEALTGADYFAQDTLHSPVQHFWSLAVEEQFYLAWPLLILLVALVVRRLRRQPDREQSARTAITAVLLVGCAASLLWSIHATAASPATAYFSTLTRAWELGVGALLALWAPHVRVVRSTFLNAIGLLGLGAITAAALLYTAATPFPGSAALLPVLGSAMVLAGGVAARPRGAAVLLDRRPMRWVGDLSYSLYLWHWPFLLIPALATGHDLGLLRNCALVAAALAVSALTYRYVETPFRTGAFWGRRRLAIGLWPSAVGVVLAAVGLVSLQLPSIASVPPVLDPQQAGDRPDVVLAVEHAAQRASRDEPLPDGLAPAPGKLSDSGWMAAWDPDCLATFRETTTELCPLGDQDADRTIAVVGDSHLGMWTQAIGTAARRHHWRVVPLVKLGCPPFDVPMFRPNPPRRYTECDRWRPWVLDQLRRIAPDRILLAGFTDQALFDPETGRRAEGDTGRRGRKQVVAGMARTLDKMRKITPDLWVLGDTTRLPDRAPSCLTTRGADLGTCVTPQDPEMDARSRAWAGLVRDRGGHYIDVRPWLCADDLCPLVVGNVIVYSDYHHLSLAYTGELTPLLGKALFG